jgi:hypothetical protein
MGPPQGPSSRNGDVAILHVAANLRFALAFKTGLTYVFFETFWLVAILAPSFVVHVKGSNILFV